MNSKPLLALTAQATTFRVADTEPPLEEVSETGGGQYDGVPVRFLYTVRVTPGADVDRIGGNGILYAKGARAPFRISGEAAGGPDFSERVRGTGTFGPDCTGRLVELSDTKVWFRTAVDPSGQSATTVWRDAEQAPRAPTSR